MSLSNHQTWNPDAPSPQGPPLPCPIEPLQLLADSTDAAIDFALRNVPIPDGLIPRLSAFVGISPVRPVDRSDCRDGM
jgi:hypothetical protein